MSNLFRKKSLDRISSPEQLNAYVRVSTPSVWLLLVAIIILLLGVCTWGIFGHMDTTISAVAASVEGVTTAYVREADAGKVCVGANVSIAGQPGEVLSIGHEPVRASDVFSEYMHHVSGIEENEWVYAILLNSACDDGVYTAQIVVESVSPITFVLN